VSLPSVQAALAELPVPAFGAEEVADSVCFSAPPVERVFVRTRLATAFGAAVGLVDGAEELFCRP